MRDETVKVQKVWDDDYHARQPDAKLLGRD
jgi:hypothetical protein